MYKMFIAWPVVSFIKNYSVNVSYVYLLLFNPQKLGTGIVFVGASNQVKYEIILIDKHHTR
jgi:hypothetical protein